MNLAKLIDHTILKPIAGKEDILRVCDEARKHGFCSVCINPFWVPYAKELLAGSDVKVCTVIGFPLGANTTAVKTYETQDAIKNGADEIDMVINIGALKDKDYDTVLQDIQSVRGACKGHILKVIIETSQLTDAEKVKACEISAQAGADFLIRVQGISMQPTFVSGDLVACKKMDADSWVDFGDVYVVDGQQGIMIKRIFNDSATPDQFLCRSDNPEVAPFRPASRPAHPRH